MPTTRSMEKSNFCPIATDNVFIGDRSQSMMSTNFGSQEGAVEYMRNQKNNFEKMDSVKGNYVEYISFDNKITVIYSGYANNITEEDYKNIYSNMNPRGSTALYDTIYIYLNKQMKRLDRLKKSLSKEVKVLVDMNPNLINSSFAIMTDGVDNCSKKTEKECKELIEKYKKEYGGIVLFIASNYDAEMYASKLGIDKKNALQMGNNRCSSIEAAKVVSLAQYRSASSQYTQDTIPMFTQYERAISNSQNTDDYDESFSIPSPPQNKRLLSRSYGGIHFENLINTMDFPTINEDAKETKQSETALNLGN